MFFKIVNQFIARRRREKIRALRLNSSSEKVREMCSLIGLYFLGRYQGNYLKTTDFIMSIQFTNIEIKNNTLIVYCARPGLFIGRKGCHYEAISKQLEKYGLKLNVIETFSWNDWIIPFNPHEY